MKIFILILISSIQFGFINAQVSKVLSQEEFKTQIKSNKNIHLIDVRTPEEYQAGHIKNAKNINFNASDFNQKVSKLDKSKPVYVYCHSGGRSAKSTKLLTELGFKEVYDLKGGYSSWKED